MIIARLNYLQEINIMINFSFNLLFGKKYDINDIILGIGDWGLGIGDWGLGPIPNPPIPNPQSPIPNPHFSKINSNYKYKLKAINLYLFNKR